MRHLDYYWMSNENWYHMNKNCVYVLNDDAPQEAKKSYEHFLEQEKNHKSVFDNDYIEPKDNE